MTGNNEVWTLIYEKLLEQFPQTVRTLWFSSLSLVAMDENQCILVSDSDMKANIINKKYVHTVQKVIEETVGFPLRVCVLSAEHEPIHAAKIQLALANGEQIKPFLISDGVREEESSFLDTTAEREKTVEKEIEQTSSLCAAELDTTTGDPHRSFASREYTFENFIVGSSNSLACAACIAVANKPASTNYNPLFIHGPSGLGKTHLLYAITNRILENNPDANIIYIKGEAFTNQLIASFASKTAVEFRNKYRKADVLLIDDIQFIAGKDATQEEFFHTFNALYEDRKQIILTSDRPPKDIKTLEERLRTRFEWGVIIDIQPPDLELRVAIAQSKAQSMNLDIPYEVLTYLAEKLKNNVRQIEGALRRLSAYTNLSHLPITMDAARDSIADVLTGAEPTNVTLDRIFAVVAKKYGVTPADIKGARRSKEIAFARHVSIYIVRQVTDLSLPSIGKILNRDHTTILSSIAVVEQKMAESPILEQEILDMIAEIRKEM